MQKTEKPMPKNASVTPHPTMAVGIGKVGAMIGLSTPTVRKLISEGRLRSVRIGGRHLVPMSALDALLNEDA